ncbi:ABC transporter ATP-binding protein [Paenibacillus fonticola]|uniref:ABC transporter ATP-binding protein n=1 Tax=Paenibacillus fonticola TaxID=379896 RepID=UPI000360C167|nr:ABC transporter ATP-binding protein [Paenibacillus fonticola]
MLEYAIDTKQLTRRIGRRETVKEINLKVPIGGIYGFLGPNGAGKTTTIRMLLGLIKPSSGEISILGKDLKRDRINILGEIGSLVESPSYYAHLSGYKNLKIIALIRGISETRIKEVLKLVRLDKDAYRQVKNYSLGMKQRLGIAAALITYPKLLILDEPTNGLDPSGIQEIRELITRLPRDYGITVLISSHLLSEIEQVATHVGIINNGELIFQGSIQKLTEKSRPYLWIETDHPEEAAIALRQYGWDADPELVTNQVKTSVIEKPQSAEMIKLLVNSQHEIYRVAEKKKTLEDIFLELTGQEHSL